MFEDLTTKLILGSLTIISLGATYVATLWVVDNVVHSKTNVQKIEQLTKKVHQISKDNADLLESGTKLSNDNLALLKNNAKLSKEVDETLTLAELLQKKLEGALQYVQLLEARNEVLREALLSSNASYFKTLKNLDSINSSSEDSMKIRQDFYDSLSNYLFEHAKRYKNVKLVLDREEEDLIAKKKEFFLSSTFESMNLNIFNIIDQFGPEFYYSSIMFLKVVMAYYPFRHLILYNWVQKLRKKKVGALTSKIKAFSFRTWEQRSFTETDDTESVSFRLRIEKLKTKRVRILPLKYWISNKRRYCLKQILHTIIVNV
jgi:hypothetical protein